MIEGTAFLGRKRHGSKRRQRGRVLGSVVSIGTPVAREYGSRRVTLVRTSTAITCLVVVAILSFVAWKVLDLASVSDRSRQEETAFAAMETEVAVLHGLEWEARATGVNPTITARLSSSRSTIDSLLAGLAVSGLETPTLSVLQVDAEHVSAALDRELGALSVGDDVRAATIDEEETDPAFARFTRELQTQSASKAKESRQALDGFKAGTAFGLGCAAAVILALLCLVTYLTRTSAKRQATTLDELRQSQKMEAIGKLAGGIAHDFNNLLTAISGYSELALSRLDKHADPELRSDIEQIAKSGERAAELTRQLLALSRRQTLQPTAFDLNDAVAGIESLLRRLIGTHITIATTLGSDECTIRADHGQIEQVIMNLALNSRDAMQDGGVLKIETEAVRLTSSEALERFQAPAGEYVVLRVADDGSGMDEATRQRAFEPFYTTKALGEGTGLGLATVYGIVAQSGGYTALDSKLGAGTTVEVLLPHLAAHAPISEPPPATVRVGGIEGILLVEDEEVVRNFTQALLSREGYDVTVASAGAQALELVRDHHFDLVITDMVMPGMSGRELVERLARKRPDLPIILISGYAHDVSGDDVGVAHVFLQKPYSAHDLSTAVRHSLDRNAAHAA